MTETKDLWGFIVDNLRPRGQLALITDIVAGLATAFNESGALPDPFVHGRNRAGIAALELVVHPVGAIGSKLSILAGALADPASREKFHVVSANVVDVQPEHLEAGRDGSRAPGLHLSYDGLPVLLLRGEASRILLTMDGFERAVFGLTEEVPGLWERVRRATGAVIGKAQGTARKLGRSAQGWRRDEVQQARQERAGPIGQLGLTLPASTIRPILIPGDGGPTSGEDVLLVPIQGQKASSGAYPQRRALQMLRIGLGVQTVLADYRLRVLLQNRDRAHNELAAVLPMSVGHLRDIGVEHLAAWTRFDTTEQVRTWVEAEEAGRPVLRNFPQALIKAELAPVTILTRALLHAERVVDAHDQGERQSPEAAAATIGQAYRDSRGRDMSVEDLVQVAALADVNPAIFWSVPHDDVALPLEVARVMGRILAGAKATLPLILLAAVREAVNANPAGDNAGEAAVVAAVRPLAQRAVALVGPENLLRSLDRAAGIGNVLVIERKTHRIRLLAA